MVNAFFYLNLCQSFIQKSKSKKIYILEGFQVIYLEVFIFYNQKTLTFIN
jgi:hypothetical protein